MGECHWEAIYGFKSENEFSQFILWIKEQIKEGIALEIPVETTYTTNQAQQEWFIYQPNGIIWQLIWPDDSPLTGSFRVLDRGNKCTWNEISDFPSHTAFEHFAAWVEKQVKLEKAEEVPVTDPRFKFGNDAYGEKWYAHLESETVWRLLWPDPPFMGAFDLIFKSNSS